MSPEKLMQTFLRACHISFDITQSIALTASPMWLSVAGCAYTRDLGSVDGAQHREEDDKACR